MASIGCEGITVIDVVGRRSWDEAGVGSPVVRCYVGDNEQRWFMWHSGRGAGSPDLDALLPASGSVGAPDGLTQSLSHGMQERRLEASNRPCACSQEAGVVARSVLLQSAAFAMGHGSS